MSNDYYTSTAIPRSVLARSRDVNNATSSIQAGFAKLPALEKLRENRVQHLDDTGAADAYIATPAPALTSYVEGLRVTVKISATNTGAATLNLNGLGARAIKQATGGDPDAGDLTAGDVVDLIYVGTTFVMQTVTRSQVTGSLAGTLNFSGTQNFTGYPRFDSAQDKAQIRSDLGLSNISDSGVDNVPIGATTPAPATVTTLTAANFVGMVAPFAMTTAPTGWLECDGSAVSRTTYAALFSAIGTTYGVGDGSTTFNLPDLRGEFVRGWDDGRGVDSGRTFGSAQDDALQEHTHGFNVNTLGTGNPAFAMPVLYGAGEGLAGSLSQPSGPVSTWGAPGYRTASETRPRNVALMYCVKT